MVAIQTPMPTVEAIYAAYEAGQGDGYRDHLGASLIGTECERSLWLTFRWATKVRHAGRLLRLFETGNLAEARFISDLRRVGVTVLDVNPETGRQWQFRDETGHFGGSADGIGVGFVEAEKAWHVVEMKTHNAKSFAKLQKEGVQKAKPLHYAQMVTYMHLGELSRAFYLAVNKDSDELYSERVEADPVYALKLLAKAKRVIGSPRPPAKISEDPAWYICRFCDHSVTCHEGARPKAHCRSCLHSTPVADGKWHCARWDCEIDRERQRLGCEAHLYIPELIPGEQIDAGPDFVTYRMKDGTLWTDGVPQEKAA